MESRGIEDRMPTIFHKLAAEREGQVGGDNQLTIFHRLAAERRKTEQPPPPQENAGPGIGSIALDFIRRIPDYVSSVESAGEAGGTNRAIERLKPGPQKEIERIKEEDLSSFTPEAQIEILRGNATPPLPGDALRYGKVKGLKLDDPRVHRAYQEAMAKFEGVKDPYVDLAMAAPVAGATAGLLAKGGSKLTKEVASRMLKRGGAAAFSVGTTEPIIGTAAEELSGGDDNKALALNLAFGLVSGATIENLIERKMLSEFAKTLSKQPNFIPLSRKVYSGDDSAIEDMAKLANDAVSALSNKLKSGETISEDNLDLARKLGLASKLEQEKKQKPFQHSFFSRYAPELMLPGKRKALSDDRSSGLYLPPGQGFEMRDVPESSPWTPELYDELVRLGRALPPPPEVRLRPRPGRALGPTYPEGAQYVAGKQAPEDLEVIYKTKRSSEYSPELDAMV